MPFWRPSWIPEVFNLKILVLIRSERNLRRRQTRKDKNTKHTVNLFWKKLRLSSTLSNVGGIKDRYFTELLSYMTSYQSSATADFLYIRYITSTLSLLSVLSVELGNGRELPQWNKLDKLEKHSGHKLHKE